MIVLTESSTPVQFNISSSTGYSYIGTTTANAATFVSIPSSFQVRESSYTYRHLGLHVTSSPNLPISIVMIGYTSTPRSTYLALPCHDQPTEEYIYYGISHESSENYRYSQILIVGCRANTTVTITPTQTIQLPQDPQQSNSAIVTITAGTSHTVTIHALQTLLIAAEFVDLTGTKVISNYPLTVIGGHDCTTVPVSYLDCDPIATQSPPTINWGTQFLVIPLQSRNNGQMVKVMSSENGTNVVIRCSDQSLHSNLAFAGNFISYYVGSLHYCHILCSQPCYVAEFAFGRVYNSYIWDGYGDPLIMTVPSIRQYIHSVTFTTLPEMPTNFFGIVVPADSYFNGTVLINNVLTTYDWTIIYNINGTISGYGYTTTANGNYTISHSHPNGKIYVSVYGFSHYGGYGYPAGMLLDLLAVSRNSTQHVNSSSLLSIYQTNCLPMTQSTTVITITTTNQMIPTHMYHVTSDTTPVHSTLTVKDTCTETITTTTVTTSIVGSPLYCDYSTVLAQASTITVYSKLSTFTNVPVTTVTFSSMLPYTTSKTTYCECSSTAITTSVTSYVIKSTSCTEMSTTSNITAINMGFNIGLMIICIICIIICSAASILSYRCGVRRGKNQANNDGYELMDFNRRYHPEPDISPGLENNEPTPIDNTQPNQNQPNINVPLTEQQQLTSQASPIIAPNENFQSIPIIFVNQSAFNPDPTTEIAEQSLLEPSIEEPSSRRMSRMSWDHESNSMSLRSNSVHSNTLNCPNLNNMPNQQYLQIINQPLPSLNFN